MAVPDHRDIPRKLFESGLFDLRTHDGHGAFVDAVVSALHARDERWGHLKKKPGQTAIHGHGEDAALYRSNEPGQSQAVDFVGGAGGPNPQPAWQVDQPRYSASDWLDPTQHGVTPAPAPQPVAVPQLPGREEMIRAGERLDQYYRSAEGLQRSEGLSKDGIPDWEGVGAWLFDVYLHARVNGLDAAAAFSSVIAEIRKTGEWRAKHPNETP
jgi:hypothetical protein